MSFWLTLASSQGQPVAFSLGQFTNNSTVLMNGASAVQAGHLDLGATRESPSAGAWFPQRVFLEGGFTTTFSFQIPSGTREGFAFVIQNNAVPLAGTGGKGLGYEGIANSVAIEFDARRNSEHLDLAPGHISINTRGIYPNVASHVASIALSAVGFPDFMDGNVHAATVQYSNGRLQVFLDNTNSVRIDLRADLAKIMNLGLGQAWIGFTSDGALTNARVFNWSFTPAQQGPAIRMTAPGNNATFAFGSTVSMTSTGAVTRVDFFDGTTLLASDTTAPFQFNWNNASPGIHTLTAIGYASDGKRSASAPVRITVNPMQPPIGINFSRGGAGTNYPLSSSQVAGIVPQSQWNNVVPASLGNGLASNLRDGTGAATPATVQFQFNAPGEEMAVDATLSPDHLLMRSYLANNALIFGQTTSFLKITNIPYAAYDVIVYSDGDNRAYDRVTEFRIGSDSIFLRDQAYATFAGIYAESRGTANVGLNTPTGNYVRFRGLTNDNFTLDIFERSFADYSRRAVVNAVQIVPAGPGSALRAVQVVRGPYMQSGSTTNMTVCWRTDLATNAVVRYGTNSANLNLTAIVSESAVDHAVRLTGLSGETKYYFALGASGTNFPASTENYFVTSPIQSRPVRIWAVGDAGMGDYNEATVRDAFLDFTRDRKPDLMLLLGDNGYNNGADAEYQGAIFDMFAPTLGQTPLWSCMGNHETYTQDMPYFRIFNFPTNGEAGGVPSGSESYYSFNYANIHFLCLETTILDRSPDAPMMTWARQDLAANTNQWLIAYFHHPPHSKGNHSSDDPVEIEMIDVRQNILPILEDYGVDLILSGNCHSYERSLMMNGYYGTSDTFDPQYIVQGGPGRADEAGPYTKPGLGVAPHSGTISIVAGSGSILRPDYGLNEPVMVRSLSKLGSVLLDIDGPNLEVKMIRENGTVADYFSVRKGMPTNGPAPVVRISARASFIGESVPSSPVFDITREGLTNDPLKVFYRISGTAENGRDYARLGHAVTIPAGQQTATLSVTPINDTEAEGLETLTLSLDGNTAPFRMVVIPDTRAYVAQLNGGTTAMLDAQARWITEQADAQNIAFVLQTGDITANNLPAEWSTAQGYLRLPVPAAIVPGARDGFNSQTAQSAAFNAAFPVSDARTRTDFGGVFESNKLENAYYFFSGGGLDWLVLALEPWPRDEVLEWANRVVAANPQRRVIVLTHAFLAEDDSVPAAADYGRDNSPAQVWDKLLRRHGNVALVISGHTEGDGLARRVDMGDYGNPVVQIAANFSNGLNGGNGYLRVLQFDPAQDRLHVQTFSPYLNASKVDPANQFDVLDLGLFKPWHTRYAVHSVSNTATITIQDNDIDSTRPTLISARAIGPSRQVVLTFSEAINDINARDIANYSISGFAITNATLLADGKTVVLSLSAPMQDGVTYSINISGIRDRAAPPNLILPSTSTSFTHRLVFLSETFDDRTLPGWLIVDEGTVDAPSIWSAPAGKLDQSSTIHGPDDLATDNRQGTYVYWSRPEALAWNNYVVRATIRSQDDEAVGLLFWFQDSANYYKIELDHRNSFYKLLSVTSGYEILLAEESGTFALNSDLHLIVEAVDDRIFATLNGEPLFGGIVTNAASGSGTIGLYCWNNAGVTFDDVEVAPSPPNNPPTVNLTAPAANAVFLPPTDITLSASASDADGIYEVEFFAGAELIGVDSQGPSYTLVWSNVPPGEYVLTVIAKDTRGFSTLSAPVPVHVLFLDQKFDSPAFAGWLVRDEGTINAPSSWQVSGARLIQLSNIYGPASDAVVNRSGTFAVWDDAVAYRWRDYQLTATLSSNDDDGIGLLFRYRDPNNYYKLEFDAQRDFRKLLRKLNGIETTLASEAGGYLTNTSFTVQVKVVDGQIEARMNGALLFGGLVPDGQLPIGTIGLYCWGNSDASFDDVRVAALSPPDQPPLVSLVSPANNSNFMPPANITLFAQASDADGTVQVVDFLSGDTVLGTATGHPYAFTWNNVTLGTYSLRACAVDNFGVRSFSTPVEVTVAYPPGYVVLHSPTMPSPGTLQFRIDAPEDTPIVIEASPDLVEWTPIATITNTTSFSPPVPQSQSRQFYRARHD